MVRRSKGNADSEGIGYGGASSTHWGFQGKPGLLRLKWEGLCPGAHASLREGTQGYGGSRAGRDRKLASGRWPPEQLRCSVRWKGDVMAGQSACAMSCSPAQESRGLSEEGGLFIPSLRSWTFLLTVPPGTQSQTSKWTQALFPGYPES